MSLAHLIAMVIIIAIIIVIALDLSSNLSAGVLVRMNVSVGVATTYCTNKLSKFRWGKTLTSRSNNIRWNDNAGHGPHRNNAEVSLPRLASRPLNPLSLSFGEHISPSGLN